MFGWVTTPRSIMCRKGHAPGKHFRGGGQLPGPRGVFKYGKISNENRFGFPTYIYSLGYLGWIRTDLTLPISTIISNFVYCFAF